MSAKVEMEEIISIAVPKVLVMFYFSFNLPNSVHTLKTPLDVYICCFVGRGATVQYIYKPSRPF